MLGIYQGICSEVTEVLQTARNENLRLAETGRPRPVCRYSMPRLERRIPVRRRPLRPRPVRLAALRRQAQQEDDERFQQHAAGNLTPVQEEKEQQRRLADRTEQVPRTRSGSMLIAKC